MKNCILLFSLIASLISGSEKSPVTIAEIDFNTNKEFIDNKIFIDTLPVFPERCLGIWEGTMHIYRYNTLLDSVPVRFTVARTETEGTYIWKTDYLSSTRPMTKDYKLVVDDLTKGRYLLDEGDGVNLVEYNVGNKLYSLFKVEDIYLTSSTELIGEQLVFEVTSGKKMEETKGVLNFSYTNVQRVVLNKVSK